MTLQYRAPSPWLARHALAWSILLMAGAPAASTCDTGKQQSPVDIVHTVRTRMPPLVFDYRPTALRIANDGHTTRVRLGKGSQLQIGKQRFTLQQFHFHTPGGDRIAGEEFPMAAHLLHKSSSGQLVAVVVLFRLGAENSLLASLMPHIPLRADGDHALAGTAVDPAALLPGARGYYRYSGSLTAPPCTEGVEWIVLRQPMELSAAQLAAYRQRFADNARAIQALNRRSIAESM